MKNDQKNIVNFLFETGILAKTPRSGFHFLGSGKQSVAEHTLRTAFIGYVLGMLHGKVDTDTIMRMCLFHDLAEGRTSDLNYVHQKYVTSDEIKAMKDLAASFPFGNDILKTLKEYKTRKSTESLLAKDADNLEWILSLKEQIDIGNKRALSWTISAIKRLKTPVAKKLAKVIMATDSNNWWYTSEEDDWWINRSKKNEKKRF
jgi:putative hydrolase of HD superfamily